MNYSKTIGDESAMLDFGGKIASHISTGLVIFLNGDLGAGKTTLVRGFLRQLGYNGAVKSPTFTLVESYPLNNLEPQITNQKLKELLIYHFDLYRLCDAEELDYMGMSDYLDGQAVVLIEWPEKGDGFLPIADIVINIQHKGKQREIDMIAQTGQGKCMLGKVKF